MSKWLVFDMDGTIADLYAVDNWLEKLRSADPTPYLLAKPLVNLSLLARYLHKAQANGYKLAIVSWLSKESTAEYDEKVTTAKLMWLKKHLPSVVFDEIAIIAHGTPKSTAIPKAKYGVLFDDEEYNRTEWNGLACEPQDMFECLRCLF